MAANKFATMVHRNTNKITLTLVYVLLEWTLIVLLFFYSLLSYFIIKFANYFGLKPPCFWCSRIDHFFEPEKGKNFYIDPLCEAHATEISKLGYCLNHQKLAAYQNMCEVCSSSRPDFRGVSKNFNFLPWVKEIGMVDDDDADKVFDSGLLRCSCCDVSLEKHMYSPYVLIKPDWDDLECDKKEFSNPLGSDLLVVGDHFKDDHWLESKDEVDMISDVNRGYCLIEGKTVEDSDSSVSVSNFGLEELRGGGDGEVEMLLEEKREFFKEKSLSKVMEDLISDEIMIQVCNREETFCEIHPEHMEFFIEFSGHRLVPVELKGLTTEEYELNKAKENQNSSDLQDNIFSSEYAVVAPVETVVEDYKLAAFQSVDIEETVNSLVSHAKQSVYEYKNADRSIEMEGLENSMLFNAKDRLSEYENVDKSMGMDENEQFLFFHAHESYADYGSVDITQPMRNSSVDNNDVQGIAAMEEPHPSYVSTVCGELCQVQNNENEPEILVGAKTAPIDAEDVDLFAQSVSEEKSQIIDNGTEAEISKGTIYSTDENQGQESIGLLEDFSPCSVIHYEDDHEHGIEIKLQQQETLKLSNLAIEISEKMTYNQLSASTERNGTGEEKIPDTPTSLDSFHHLHKKILLLDRKESGTEESLDGSLLSEFESGDGVMTVEHLTSALRAERKALHVVYAELEEERSASAVAANQTMAMINRLQEEKAAMQMEALQYQRMMDEQLEYDQEAMQLLNELLIKREREKQDLEKELDIYRKKVTDYEAKEKMKMLKRSKDGSARGGFSSTSFSNREDSDGISVDFNQDITEDGFHSHQDDGNHNTPVDTVLQWGDSFGEFEEERLSILEQLKVLEDKLFTLSDDEHHYENVKPIKHYLQGNDNHFDENFEFSGEELNGLTNGCLKEINGKHHLEGRIMGTNAKSLLPLFDVVTTEIEDGEVNEHDNGFESAVTRFELEERRVSIEEEIDQLYARMHALETDKEFLKHCINSLKKGDKGAELLQEILYHLRDLRNMELRAKEFTDGTLI